MASVDRPTAIRLGLGVKRLSCRYSMSTFVLDTYEQSIRSWIPQSGHTRDSWRYTLHYRSPFPFTDWGRFEFQEHRGQYIYFPTRIWSPTTPSSRHMPELGEPSCSLLQIVVDPITIHNSPARPVPPNPEELPIHTIKDITCGGSCIPHVVRP